MNNTLKLAMGAIATLTGAHFAQQTPVVPLSAERPSAVMAEARTVGQSASAPAIARAAPDEATQNERALTLEFRGTVQELAKALKAQGVNFVIRESDARDLIIVNFERVPMAAAMRSLGRAMGGMFVNDGGVYTFQKGSVLYALPPAMESAPAVSGWYRSDAVPLAPLDPKELKKMTEQLFKSDEALRAHSKALEKMYTEVEKQRTMNGASGYALDKKKLEALRKEVDGAMKGWKGDLFVAPEVFRSSDPAVKKGAHPSMFRWGSAIPSGNFTKLFYSLSTAQKAKHKKQGYLSYSDLTAAQKKLLPAPMGKGNWKISVIEDGKSLTIQSDR